MSGRPNGEPMEGSKPNKGKSFDIEKRLVFRAWEKVRANAGAPGVDAVSIDVFGERWGDNLYKLWNRMSSGSYFPRPVRAVEIPKPGRYRPPETLLAFLGSL
jgi:RNA-directed DNA polymerase